MRKDWNREYIPQSVIFESFSNKDMHISWGVSLWPKQESFFVDIINRQDGSAYPWGTSNRFTNYQEAFSCVLDNLQIDESEYNQIIGESGNKYSRAIMKLLSKFKDS